MDWINIILTEIKGMTINGVAPSLVASKIYDIKDKKGLEKKLKNLGLKIDEKINRVSDPVIREKLDDYILSYLKDYINHYPEIDKESLTSEFTHKYNKYLDNDSTEILLDTVQLVEAGLRNLLDDRTLIALHIVEKRFDKLDSSIDSVNVGLDVVSKKMDNNNDILKEIRDNVSKQNFTNEEKESVNPIFKDHRKEFIEKWDDVLFLHRGEPEEKQVRLRDIHVVPDFQYATNKEAKYDDLEAEIDYFIKEQEEFRVLIILGQPGIGKSSLVSKMANDNNDYIFLQFKKLNIGDGIISGINNGLNRIESLENKTVIIDGYDEVTTGKNINHITNLLKHIWSIQGLKIIITSRLNYIDVNYKNIIKLKPFGIGKIEKFDNKYKEIIAIERDITKFNTDKIEIYGIPLLLYMIYGLEISVTESDGLNELYSRIFTTEDGGIYDKCRTRGRGYDKDTYHANTSEHKEELHLIAQEIAFAMFEKNRLELTKDEYVKIVNQVSPERKQDFAIANYYDIGEKLCFVHKSIYEYFVAEYMYQRIKEALTSERDEALAKCFG